MKKKILVITPRFPFQGRGACEQDRAWGVRRLVELGFEVEVITKCLKGDLSEVAAAQDFSGARITPVLYVTDQGLGKISKFLRILKRFVNPLFIDGAAFEYTEPVIQKKLTEKLDTFKPDIVWFDYTYLWPLYTKVRKRGVPIITRSINFEPLHFLEEDGYTLKNYLKYLPKLASEYLSVKRSDVVLSITPKEEKIYKKWHSKVFNLPLRGLARVLKSSHEIRQRRPLHIFFMGSTYNVNHNKEALLFITRDLAPKVRERGDYVFHILGSKVPESANRYFEHDVVYDGPKYNDDLEVFLKEMDAAIIPSLMGAGMQQKIFEPMSRAIPTLTSTRGIAGYPFKEGESVLLADNLGEFVHHLDELSDLELRKRLSKSSSQIAGEIFSQEKIDSIVLESINLALKK